MRRGPLRQGQIERNAPDVREFLLFSDCLIWLAGAEDGSGGGNGAEHRAWRPKLQRGRSKSETELPMAKQTTSASTNTDERWSFKGRAELVDLEVVVSPAGRDQEDRTRFDVLSPEVSFAVYAGECGSFTLLMVGPVLTSPFSN